MYIAWIYGDKGDGLGSSKDVGHIKGKSPILLRPLLTFQIEIYSGGFRNFDL